jgi:hypothetical protein
MLAALAKIEKVDGRCGPRSNELRAKLSRAHRRRWRRKRQAERFMREQTKAPMSTAKTEAMRRRIAAQRSGAVTRAERILCAMLPNVYYARRELEALLALKRDAIGATLYRDLLRPGYVRKHNFGHRGRYRNTVSSRLSSVAFRLTDLGMAKRQNTALRVAASAKQTTRPPPGSSRSG